MADSGEDWIRRRAYELWESEGYPSGKDTEHWERAKLEFSSQKPVSRASAKPRKGTETAKASAKPEKVAAPEKAAASKVTPAKTSSPASKSTSSKASASKATAASAGPGKSRAKKVQLET